MHQPIIGNWTLADLLKLAAIVLSVVFALGILGGVVYFLTPGA